MVGYLFVNASQGVGDEIVVTQIVLVFIWVSGLFRVDFSKPPYLDVQPPKEQKQQKTAFLIKIGKRFCHFLDTGREMILNFHQGGNGIVIGLPAFDIFGMHLYSESRLQ